MDTNDGFLTIKILSIATNPFLFRHFPKIESNQELEANSSSELENVELISLILDRLLDRNIFCPEYIIINFNYSPDFVVKTIEILTSMSVFYNEESNIEEEKQYPCILYAFIYGGNDDQLFGSLISALGGVIIKSLHFERTFSFDYQGKFDKIFELVRQEHVEFLHIGEGKILLSDLFWKNRIDGKKLTLEGSLIADSEDYDIESNRFCTFDEINFINCFGEHFSTLTKLFLMLDGEVV